MTYEQVEHELLLLEARSKGLMKLDIAGTTIEGRNLYIAKLGTGPDRMWIQGRIHGNEPLGNDVCLEIIKGLLSSDRPAGQDDLLDHPHVQPRWRRAHLARQRQREWT